MPDLFTDPAGLPHTTRSNIPYEVDVLSYKEEWIEGANVTTVLCRVRSVDSPTWITDMVGRVYTQEEEVEIEGVPLTIRYLRRDLPEANPFYPNQWCTRVRLASLGDNPDSDPDQAPPFTPGTFADPVSGWPVTLWMVYEATFTGLPFKLLTDKQIDDLDTEDEPEMGRYVLRQRKVYTREWSVPGGQFKIVGTNQPLQATWVKFVQHATVRYTQFRVPVATLPLTKLRSLQGLLNNSEWDTTEGGYKWPTGTLLYDGFSDDKKYFDANGDWVCDLVTEFKYRSIGHNFFIDNLGQAVEVSTDGTANGVKPYEFTGTDNFNALFRAEPA